MASFPPPMTAFEGGLQRELSSKQHAARSVKWIPAFAGMTKSLNASQKILKRLPARTALPGVMASTLTLSACGFHFAGSEPLPEPLKSVYIELIDPYHVTVPPLEASLQARLVRSGGEVKSKSGAAKTVLRLTDLQETQEVLSIGPDGKAIEYRLVSRVTYELRSGNRELIPPQSQGLDRAYSFSATQILPKEAEEARLSRFVQDDLAEVILLRIQAQLRRHPDGLPGTSAEVPVAAVPATPGATTGLVSPSAAAAPVTPTAAPAGSAGVAPAP